jgi:hypothetical protein
VDEQPDQRTERRHPSLSSRRVRRIIGLADIAVALVMLLLSLSLRAGGYEQAAVFGVLPVWVIPAAMICLGVALVCGYGASRHQR